MKKKLFTLLLALVTIATTAQAQVVLNEENFPDANFRKALAEKFGISEGEEITAAKIAATTTLGVGGYNKSDSEKIADLTGIEHFTALTGLSCINNQLTALNVSNNTALTELYCNDNQLTLLNLPECTALTTLWCHNNQLTSLDVSNNTALTKLYCDNNQLTSLDVSKNTALTRLECHDNQLTLLNLPECTALTILWCHNNQLTSLDVSKNTALTGLCCYSNQIKGEAMDALVASLPTVENGTFCVINTKDENEGNVCTKAQVAVAKNKGWTVYDYNYDGENWIDPVEYEGSGGAMQGVQLNAENFPDANFRKALAEKFGISEGDEITGDMIAVTTWLDVSKQYAWDSEKIADLTGIEHFTALKTLYCKNNQLTSLDVSKNTALTELRCYNNRLTSLDVSKNTALTVLWCYSNQLSSLDVSKNTALDYLSCYDNQLTSLDVSGCTALTELYCGYNQLTTLDVSQNTALTGLYCYSNQLTVLDVSNNTALTSLSCDGNQLASLDVSNNTALTELYCFGNQLTSLDVSKNTALKYLLCHNNQLTSLDLSNNTALEYLYCYNNQIKGEEMDALVNSLPTVESGTFFVIDTKDENEGNVCTKAQVAVAKEKGWTVYDFNGSYSYRQEYEGSDPVEEEIDPVDEDDNVDFGSDMD